MSELSNMETMSYSVADNGVASLVIDVKNQPTNILTPVLHREIGQVADQIASDEQCIGAVISSAKPTFMAGGDLKRLVGLYDLKRTPEDAYHQSRTFTESLRKLETCGKPVVAAINGAALGGGLELALACHYRVAVDNPKILLGLPETTVGLIPGAGGTQRLPRMIGIQQAAELILTGKFINPESAHELGIVDQLVAADELLGAAEGWVLEQNAAVQPWDQRGFKIPGGAGLTSPQISGLLQRLTARIAVETQYNYPAPIAALRSIFKGTTMASIDSALKVETREFSKLTRGVEARNMIRTLFLNRGQRDRLSNRPKDVERLSDAKVICAGGSDDMAELIEIFSAARLSAHQLGAQESDLAKGDLVILDTGLTDQELTEIAATVKPDAVIATTAQPLDALAGIGFRTGQLLGLHIASPYKNAQAVEIVISRKTSAATLAHCLDVIKKIRKTPTVQQDSPELFSDACQQAYMAEGLAMVGQGIDPVLIENAARFAGMPTGPLAMALDGTNDKTGNDGNPVKLLAQQPDVEIIKQRLLSIQALKAAQYWEQGLIDIVDADLASVLIWGFPSYTGGVLSYIDSLGMVNFIDQSQSFGGPFQPSEWLQAQAAQSDRVYPVAA